ncbi:MAG: T9SS type A sorting domain-containing protein, partial [Candidatus Marinimicrobia bacterium]|nr:T9SS type A sorting domain-containing protein [Candidatus Neomarinimicrobiota bacterium]
SWAQEAKLLPSDGATEEFLGISVCICGDYAVVGAKWDDFNTGSAYVFKRTGTSWTQEAKILSASGHSFGISVSISGDYAVVGSSGEDDNGVASGSAYVFKRNGTSWSQEAKLLASDGAAFDRFGESVSISGGYAVVGSSGDDDNGDLSGSAYVYSGIIVGIEDERKGLPAEFSLSQNYPNPFNPETVIEYSIPIRSDVKLTIYNLRGEEVAILINDAIPAGNHRVSWDASNVSSGIYFYRLKTDNFVQTRKMVLLK